MFAVGLVLAVLGVLGVALLVALTLRSAARNKHADEQRDQVLVLLDEVQSNLLDL